MKDQKKTSSRLIEELGALRQQAGGPEQPVPQDSRPAGPMIESPGFGQAIIDAIPAATIIIDRDFRVVRANRRARELSGGECPQSGCLACYEVSSGRFVPCEGKLSPCPLEQVLEGKSPVTTAHTRHDTNGDEVFVEVTASPILDETGEVAYILQSFSDVTERRRAQQQLADSRHRMELVLGAGDLGTWDWDLKSGNVVFNEHWARMIGYRPDEIAPNIHSWERLIHPEDLAYVMHILNSHLDGEIAYYETEHRLLTKSGEWKWILARAKTTERDQDGRALGT